MAITPLPTPPQPTDTTAQFNTKAFAWVAALGTFVTEANATEAAVDADAATATTKAAEASASATAAASSASSAATSATAATNAKNAAESARDATLAAFDSFDDRYLGAKTSDPTVDNDGNPLVAGALYFNSVSGVMRVYTGSAWVAAYVSPDGLLPLAGGTMTGAITFAGGQTFPGTGDVTLTGTETLTNKTLTDPKLTLGGSNGTTGQVPVSQGAGLPPVWGTAVSAEIKTPTNVSPANAATNISDTPTLTGSAYYSLYGVPMAAAQWQVSTSSGFETTVISTGDVAGTAISYTVLTGALSVSTTYFWRVRYKDSEGIYSSWSIPTSFTTAAQFNNFIPTPAATPANFGDAFEGGFYTGMIWNQVTQSSTSTVIGTGSKTFTVTDAAPLFYSGQLVEIRSRANPTTQRMIGTVTASVGTTLTVNVTSVDGSGTLTDWSVMARYRVIVAPKSSGENASLQYKNATTAAPTATGTLSEGWRATEAMRVADTSTVYPAAHWTRNLNINGRTDWYLPARDELELCWRNLKPVTNNNYATADRPTGFTPNYTNLGSIGTSGNQHGVNLNSAPQGAAYTTAVPGQVAATNFRTGGAEAFEFGSAYYWSSTEYSASGAWYQDWSSSLPGYQNNLNKLNTFRVRAVRRSII